MYYPSCFKTYETSTEKSRKCFHCTRDLPALFLQNKVTRSKYNCVWFDSVGVWYKLTHTKSHTLALTGPAWWVMARFPYV
jgi:hypothetical protein